MASPHADEIEMPWPDFNSFILFKSRETAVLSSACSILLTHWYTSTVILDLTAVRLLWSICFAFTATAFVVTNVNVTICLGCLVWLYVVGTMGLLKPESHYFLIDFWVASSAIVIGFSESSFVKSMLKASTPQNAATSSTCMFLLTDICTSEMPSDSWLRISLWMLWMGYTFLVTRLARANPFISGVCLGALCIVSICVMATQSVQFRTFMMWLWASAWATVFYLFTSPFSNTRLVKKSKIAVFSSGCLLIWLHVYIRAMLPGVYTGMPSSPSNVFVACILWFLWDIYSMATFILTTDDGTAAIVLVPFGTFFMFMFICLTVDTGVAVIYCDVALIMLAIAPTSAYIFFA